MCLTDAISNCWIAPSLQDRIFSLYDTDQDEVPVTSPVVRRVRKSGIEGADVKPDKRTTLFIADWFESRLGSWLTRDLSRDWARGWSGIFIQNMKLFYIPAKPFEKAGIKKYKLNYVSNKSTLSTTRECSSITPCAWRFEPQENEQTQEPVKCFMNPITLN